ncbi:MAG: hypothetical protein QXN87_08725 [Candidatus Bathyarchaeia archaeon]
MKHMNAESALEETDNSASHEPYRRREGYNRRVYGASLIIAFCLVLFYVFQSFYPSVMYVFSNVFPPFIAGAAFIMAVLASARYYGSFKERFSQVWLSFAFGLGFWFLGEVSWAFYTLFLGVELPYPSFADIFWLGGYIPMFIALFLYVKTFFKVLSNRLIFAVALAVIVLAFMVFAVLSKPVLGFEEDLAIIFADFAYPIFDAVLFFLAILGFAVFFKGKIGRSWLFINAGILSLVAADFLFSYTTALETYYCGHPLELLFHFGDMLLFIAFYTHIKEL